MEREKLGSRLGFILLSAGCAIGVGNVWKFPWMAGQYGGGAFVAVYLLFLLILGVPTLTMEFAMGRAAQKSPMKMYQALKPGSKWHLHGYACLLGNIYLVAKNLFECIGYLHAAYVHTYAVCLHDGCIAIYVYYQARQVVTFAVDKTIGVVVLTR